MIDRPKEWWERRIDQEPDVPIGAGAPCEHEEFKASVAVQRLTDEAGAKITDFIAEIRVECSQCHRRFQFLGLEPGADTQGAWMSIDGLEASLAICPQGEQPSPLDRLAIHFGTPFGVKPS
jgi:hypothetical protein